MVKWSIRNCCIGVAQNFRTFKRGCQNGAFPPGISCTKGSTTTKTGGSEVGTKMLYYYVRNQYRYSSSIVLALRDKCGTLFLNFLTCTSIYQNIRACMFLIPPKRPRSVAQKNFFCSSTTHIEGFLPRKTVHTRHINNNFPLLI